jgi:hypothetical protein
LKTFKIYQRLTRTTRRCRFSLHVGVQDNHTFLVEEPWFYLIPARHMKHSSKKDLVAQLRRKMERQGDKGEVEERCALCSTEDELRVASPHLLERTIWQDKKANGPGSVQLD